jgi:hypothetical protein
LGATNPATDQFISVDPLVAPTSFLTGSAVVTMARQIGSVLGVAFLVAILDTTRHTNNAVAVFDHGWWFTDATAGLAALASLTFIRKRAPSPPPASATSNSPDAPVPTGGHRDRQGRR